MFNFEKLKEKPYFHSILIGILFFLLYYFSSASSWALPTFFAMDGAEFVIASRLLGLDHPPGHPLYLLLGYIFSCFPFTNPDAGLILLSSVFGSISISLLHAAIIRTTGNRISALLGTMIFGFSSIFWLHSSIIEVYTLQTYLQIQFLFFGLLLIENKTKKSLFVFSFGYSILASTNPILTGFLLPLYLLFIYGAGFFEHSSIKIFKHFLIATAGLLLGLLPLLYIPWRIHNNAAYINDINLMSRYELGSIGWYVWYWSAWEFTGNKLSAFFWDQYPGLIYEYFKSVFLNLGPIALLFIALAMKNFFSENKFFINLVKKSQDENFDTQSSAMTQEKKEFIIPFIFVLGFLITSLPVIGLAVVDREVFYLPSFVFLVFILSRAIRITNKAFTIILFIIVIIFGLFSGWTRLQKITSDHSNYNIRKALFISLPENSVILGRDDGTINKFTYFQKILNLRKDITIETFARNNPRYFKDISVENIETSQKESLTDGLNFIKRQEIFLKILEKYNKRQVFLLPNSGKMPESFKGYKFIKTDFNPELFRIEKTKESFFSEKKITPDVILNYNYYPNDLQIIGWSLKSMEEGSEGTKKKIFFEGKNYSASLTAGEEIEFSLITHKIIPINAEYFALIYFTDKDGNIFDDPEREYSSIFQIKLLDEDTPYRFFRSEYAQFKIASRFPKGSTKIFLKLHKVRKEVVGEQEGKKIKKIDIVHAKTSLSLMDEFILLGEILIF